MKRASAPLPTLVIGWLLEGVPPVVGFPGFEPAEGAEGESTGGKPTPVVGGFSIGEGPGDGRTSTVGLEPGGLAAGEGTGAGPPPAGGAPGSPAAEHCVRGGVLTLHSPGRMSARAWLMGNPNGLLVPNN